MAKRRYTDEDRAAVYTALQVNNGNVKRTARDTGVPEMTVSDWKKAWEKQPPPPAVIESATEVADAFIERATTIRNLAMDQLEDKLRQGDVSAKDLNTIFGTFTDKIRLAEGLATQRTETIGHLDPEELGRSLGSLIKGALHAAHERADIIDLGEQSVKELPEGEN